MGERGKPDSKPKKRLIRSLLHFLEVLEYKGLSGELKDEVVKYAKGYPEGALDQVYANIDKVIKQCQARVLARRPAPPEIHVEEPQAERVVPDAMDDDSPRLIAPKPAKPKPVPPPPVVRKSLFDPVATEAVEFAPPIQGGPAQDKPAEASGKFSTSSAAEVAKMRQQAKANQMQQISMNFPAPPDPRSGAPKKKETPEETYARVKQWLAANPPREGNPNNKQED